MATDGLITTKRTKHTKTDMTVYLMHGKVGSGYACMRIRTWLSVLGGGVLLFWGLLNVIGNVDTIRALFDAENPHWFIRLLAAVTVSPVVTPFLLAMGIIVFLVAIGMSLTMRSASSGHSGGAGGDHVDLRGHADRLSALHDSVPQNGPSATSLAATPDREPEKRLVIDVTPYYLSGLFNKGDTSAQADRLAAAFIGKWMKVSGRLGDVMSSSPSLAQVTFER